MTRQTTIWMLCLAVSMAGCNSHPVEPFGNTISAEKFEELEAAATQKVDILWVVDNSGSMCEEQTNLRENFDRFVEELVEVGVDFQLAVISTDIDNPLQSGLFQNRPDDRPGPSCTTVVDISQCPADGTPLIIKSSDTRYAGPQDALDVALIKRDFGCNATTGINGSSFERGLEAARRALSPALLEQNNRGFLRDDAYLAVIFLTDENDCSDGGVLSLTNGSVCEWDRDLLIPVESYIDFFKRLKTDDDGEPLPDRIIMAGIIAPDDGKKYARNEEVMPSCVSTDTSGEIIGRGLAGYRYRQLIEAFSSSYEDNICNPPYDKALESMGTLIADTVNRRCLQTVPDRCEGCALPLQVEIKFPSETDIPEGFTSTEVREPSPGQCVAQKSTVRCVLIEGEHYTIDQQSNCGPSGVEIRLLRRLNAQEQLGIRYATSLGE